MRSLISYDKLEDDRGRLSVLTCDLHIHAHTRPPAHTQTFIHKSLSYQCRTTSVHSSISNLLCCFPKSMEEKKQIFIYQCFHSSINWCCWILYSFANACTCVCRDSRLAEASGGCLLSSSITLCLNFLRQGLLLKLKFTISARLSG